MWLYYTTEGGNMVALLIEALCYKPEGHGLKSQ
jgi:hypothetical protein